VLEGNRAFWAVNASPVTLNSPGTCFPDPTALASVVVPVPPTDPQCYQQYDLYGNFVANVCASNNQLTLSLAALPNFLLPL
jgi:hypothetical protein